MAKRKYRMYATHHVECPECNEDITEGGTDTKAEAAEYREAHEAWHRRDEEGVTQRDADKGDDHGTA